MPRRIAISSLNASTIDILNTIRQNASEEYQQLVPTVEQATDIPRVGEVLYGYPALANQFLSALINRVALTIVRSATYNNPYRELKKGFLEFGETVEEVYINLTKAREFNPEKAEEREFRRSLPDVRAAFHTINWRPQYPITIQYDDLRQAFLSENGVQDLIARIVDSVYTSAEYDEFLLFKYLLIQGVTAGKMYPVQVDTAGDVYKNSAVEFRSISNMLTFMSTKYNAAGVHTVTPRRDQYIFMDAKFNAQFDVNVLASAFNMDKTDFMGRLFLIDDFTTFDMDRFSSIMAESDAIAPITDEQLALMAGVHAIIVDGEFFQVYDNLDKMSEKYVASGLYWNYFYNQWKIISYSPFANAIVFAESATPIELPETITVEITDKSIGENATVFTLVAGDETPALNGGNIEFVQTADATEKGIAIHKYGAVILPANSAGTALQIMVNGTMYATETNITPATAVGATLEFALPENEEEEP